MSELKETGGARIGMANTTWPLATLTVTSDKLHLKAGLVGTLIFSPTDVISIEPYVQIPLLGQGIKINHRVPGYNEKVIFWTFVNPRDLIERIKATGFAVNDPFSSTVIAGEIAERQKGGSFPIKRGPAIALVVLWNLLIISDVITNSGLKNGLPLGNGSKIALAMVFLTGLLTLVSQRFRNLILKPGITVDDVRSSVLFLLFITGVMFTAFMFAF